MTLSWTNLCIANSTKRIKWKTLFLVWGPSKFPIFLPILANLSVGTIMHPRIVLLINTWTQPLYCDCIKFHLYTWNDTFRWHYHEPVYIFLTARNVLNGIHYFLCEVRQNLHFSCIFFSNLSVGTNMPPPTYSRVNKRLHTTPLVWLY